jgi:hypothetical protein
MATGIGRRQERSQIFEVFEMRTLKGTFLLDLFKSKFRNIHQSHFRRINLIFIHLKSIAEYSQTSPLEKLNTNLYKGWGREFQSLGNNSYVLTILLNPAKQSKQAKQASKQANQQIGLG